VATPARRRRMKDRMAFIRPGLNDIDGLTLYTVEDHWPRADDGGLDAVAGWLVEHPGGVVIIDMLGRFRSLESKGNAYFSDIKALEPIQSLALSQHSLILCSHHDNKNLDVEDWEYRISGTQGVAGTADMLVGLARTPGSKLAALKFNGRDVECSDVIVRLQRNPSGWIPIGTIEGSGGRLSPEREEVVMRLWAADRELPTSKTTAIYVTWSCPITTFITFITYTFIHCC